jgi:large subunit ribosomal protein L24
MSQPKFRIKRGDLVVVTTGKYKGKKGTVQKVLKEDEKLIVEGVNVVIRNQKPSMDNPEGRVQKILPIHISNVALVDPSTNRAGRVSYRIEGDRKVRFFKKTGEVLG